ncbi:MAG TPA: hemerythrin domain-containing protein [Planctomycetota bacterium]|nr:hemerythrin domain-containing protein [Planctomycetota bacterium]
MDPGANFQPANDDPIDVLLAEHRTILQVLDEIERESRRLEHDAPLREAFWRDVLRFADEFDAGLHHQKEERLLFPALEAAGLSTTSGPTAVLRDEHLRSDFWRQRLERALRARDRNRLAAAVASYVDLTRTHVIKENQILFPLARRLLSADDVERLRAEFRALAAEQSLSHWLQHPYALPTGN